MLAVIGELPVLIAVNEGMFPVPDAPKPIADKEFVQVILFDPAATKFTDVDSLLQTDWF